MNKNKYKITFVSPFHNKTFCSSARRKKSLTTGILELFRGLKIFSNAEIGQNRKFRKRLVITIISILFLGVSIFTSTGCGKKGEPIPKSALSEKKNVRNKYS